MSQIQGKRLKETEIREAKKGRWKKEQETETVTGEAAGGDGGEEMELERLKGTPDEPHKDVMV